MAKRWLGLVVLVGMGLLLAAAGLVPATAGGPRDEPTETPVFSFLPYVVGSGPEETITELQYETTDEYVEVTNTGALEQDMTGWKIHSVVGDQWYAFPAGYTLAAGARVRVHSGPDAFEARPTDLLWGYAHVWLNEGDKAVLYDAGGKAVDEECYGTGCP